MAEPLKYLLNDTVPPRIAAMVRRAWRKFDTTAFLQQVEPGYESLELMARGQRIAQALQAHLPQDVPRALGVLVESMDPPMGIDAAGEPDAGDRPYSAFLYLPHSIYIGTHGLPHFEAAMAAQHALTQRFTAEFAIRPFWVHHPELTLRTLHTWVHDPSAHVRRLVSEGSRPRLPWGLRLQSLVADPTPMLPLLSLLQDDPSEYVRRSVANHLNDIAKDHPQLLLHWLKTHLPEAPKTRQRLLRHACRTLIKQGHPGVMAAWGLGQPFHGQATLALDTMQVHVGGVLGLSVTLASTATQPQTLEIDLRVHYRKADGSLAPKVFKGQQITLEAGSTWPWRKKLSFRPVTTRTLYPGPHRLEVQINGQVVAGSPFELLA